MLYGEPETPQFLAVVSRMKRTRQRRVRQLSHAKKKLRAALKRIRSS